MRSPPPLARWLLRFLLPRTLRDAVIGDLTEQYQRRVPRDGQAGARRWFWAQSIEAVRTLSSLSDESTTLTPLRPPLFGLTSDFRFAWRLFSRRPVFTVIALATLSLGIGATTAIFSVAKPALLETLPYPNADRIALVWEQETDGATSNVGFMTYDDLRQRSTSFETMAAMSFWQPTLLGAGDPVQVLGQSVSAAFFSLLGVTPALGRDFRPEDDRVGAERVAILSHRLWRDRFGADPAIVGRPISLSGQATVVVGIMSEGFESLVSPGALIWRPLRYDASLPYACRDCRHLRIAARLRPQIGVSRAESELSTLLAGLKQDYPTQYGSSAMTVQPLREAVAGSSRPVFLVLFGAVAAVLLLACVNVANLLLGEAIQRRHEFAVRMAMGSGRARLIRQVLLESGLLGLVGSLLGIGVAQGILVLLRRSAAGLPRIDAIGIDWGVLAFAAGLGILAGVAFGLAPARHSVASAQESFRDSGRVSARSRLRQGLVVAEIGLAVILVLGATLLVRSMSRLLAVDPGFPTERLLTFAISPAGPRFATDSAYWQFFAAAQDAVRAVPGITAAGMVNQLPLGGGFDTNGIHFEAKPRNPTEDPAADRYAVTSGYFEATRIPLREGRYFVETDHRGSAPPVVIINEHLARLEFGDQSALGQRIRLGSNTSPWRTIIGIVGDVRHHGLDVPATHQLYLPTEQWEGADGSMVVVARTSAEPASVATIAVRAVRAIDSDVTIGTPLPMESVITQSTGSRSLVLHLFQGFAGLALTLAAIGIYGVMASAVAARRREFGVRSALGASRKRLVASVVGEAGRLATLGVALGLGTAAVLGPGVRRALFAIGPFDAASVGGTTVVLALVALGAALIPAARAARAEPATVLRSE